MTVLVLNTHDAVKRLVKTGQKPEAAEAIVELITDVHEQVATKADLQIMEARIKMVEAKVSMLQWMVGLNIAMTAGILFSLVSMN